MININAITWAAPYAWIYSPIWILIICMLIHRYIKYNHVYKMLMGTGYTLLCNVSLKKQCIKTVLMIIGVLFLFIALFRPQWNKTEEIVTQNGRDLYVALDISRSMLAADCNPNRLQCAKEKIKKLLKKLSCERVGLILFSGSAFVQCPLTVDYSAFHLYLDAVDVELISSGTTALDQAIKQALTSFDSTPDRKNKLLAIFTDGEDFSRNLHEIKQEAVEKNLSIFTIGVGTVQGAPIPLIDNNGNLSGHQKDKRGNVVISRLNEGILHSLSQDAGGKYISITENDDDIDKFVRFLQLREKEKIDEKKVDHYEDQYHYFLIISFICFIVEWLL